MKFPNKYRKWYQVILWWELARIPYNLVMYWVGLSSFYIGYVTIPLIYGIIGLALNVVYTFSWIIELIAIKKLSAATRWKFFLYGFLIYLLFSALLVYGFAMFLAFW